MDKNNLASIRQSFGNVVYNHKIHEICAEKADFFHLVIKVLNILFVAIVLVFLVIQLITKIEIFSYISIGITIAEVLFLIIQLSFNFKDKYQFHKSTALSLWCMREKYISIIADVINDQIGSEKIISRRDEMINKLQLIYQTAPQTTNKCYKEAQKRLNPKGIVKGEEFTFSDEEIDRFLPNELRFKN